MFNKELNENGLDLGHVAIESKESGCTDTVNMTSSFCHGVIVTFSGSGPRIR